jgi:hypothetical protein
MKRTGRLFPKIRYVEKPEKQIAATSACFACTADNQVQGLVDIHPGENKPIIAAFWD